MPKGRRYKKASSRIAKREKARKTLSLFLKIGTPVAFLIGLVFLSRADFLQVKGFEVVGGETALDENIKNTALSFASGTSFFLIPKSNIFLLNEGKLANVILSKFTRLERVDINKNFFGKSVKLSVEERKADYLWCSDTEECFFMTKDGLVFEKNTGENNLIAFRGVLKGDPLMKNFATPDKMQNYMKFIAVLGDVKFNVSSINIESADKATAEANIGKIIFDPEETDLSLIAQNVILLINDIKAKNPSTRFDYIDARFGNKIFYKLY